MPIILYKYLSLIIVVISGIVYLIPNHLGFDNSKVVTLFISMQILLLIIITHDTDNIQNLKNKIEELEEKVKDQDSYINVHEEQILALEKVAFPDENLY